MKELFDYIKELSIKDKKSLLGKASKLSEETGELSKALLSYENSFATTHRFITDDKVLTEACDSILAAISIPYSMGYSHEEIFERLKEKADYWAELQSKSNKINYPLPFEIHVTIEKPEDIQGFVTICQNIKVKPIVLDLENPESTTKDVMTSSIHSGDNTSAYNEMKRISTFLSESGYKVVREKIETIPTHPAAPRSSDLMPMMPSNCYFESHLSIEISAEEKDKLKEISELNDAHLSRNFFKKSKDDKYIIMATFRRYKGTYESFLSELENLKNELKKAGFNPEKEVVEFSIYDTKVSHDFNWLNSKNESPTTLTR